MSNNTTGFVSSPNCGRGTVDLIWNCLSTLTLCVWSAIHPSLNTYYPTLTKLGYCFTSVFVPEGQAVEAIDDLLNALALRKQVRQIVGWESWSLKQSFIVVKAAVRSQKTPDDISRRLNPECFLRLARSNVVALSRIPANARIDKRCKSNRITKLIALGQAGWFAANVITRLDQGYQVSLLEDVTSAYVFSAFIVYCCYWECPQDV